MSDSRRNIVYNKYDAIYEDYCAENMSVKEISNKYGVSHQTVYNVRKYFENGNKSKGNRKQNVKSNKDDEQLLIAFGQNTPKEIQVKPKTPQPTSRVNGLKSLLARAKSMGRDNN